MVAVNRSSRLRYNVFHDTASPAFASIVPALPARIALSMTILPRAKRPSVEGQHGAGDFTGLHRAEGFVDVAEPAAPGHHRIEVEPALAVEIEIKRDVGAEPVRAHARGLHLAFRADRHPRKRDRRIGGQDADDRRGAADREA